MFSSVFKSEVRRTIFKLSPSVSKVCICCQLVIVEYFFNSLIWVMVNVVFQEFIVVIEASYPINVTVKSYPKVDLFSIYQKAVRNT